MEQFTYLMIVFEVAITIILSPLIFLISILHQIYSCIFLKKSAKNIAGEVAVVTGGANGLGKGICIELAKKGCHVAVVDINFMEAEKTANILKNQYGTKAKAYKVNVANHDEVLKLSELIKTDMGVATILVNNAGILMFSNHLQPEWKEVQNMMNVNITAHFSTLEAFLPGMKEMNKGHIVAIGSVFSLFPLPHSSHYTASKFAVRGLMRALRLELRMGKHKNIHTTTVMPYFLNANPKAASAYVQSGFAKKYPMINVDAAAKSIINGMLHNRKEIGLPSVLRVLYRLYELLPTAAQDFVVYIKVKKMTLDMMK